MGALEPAIPALTGLGRGRSWPLSAVLETWALPKDNRNFGLPLRTSHSGREGPPGDILCSRSGAYPLKLKPHETTVFVMRLAPSRRPTAHNAPRLVLQGAGLCPLSLSFLVCFPSAPAPWR